MTIETLKSPNPKNRNRLYLRGKIEIFIRLFDEHFSRHFESHWRETWLHTGRRTVPQISLVTPPPPPPSWTCIIYKKVFMLALMAISFSILSFGFHRSTLYLFTLFVYLSIFIIIFSPKRRNKEFFFNWLKYFWSLN